MTSYRMTGTPLLVAALLAGPQARAAAQTFAGEIVESTIRKPLRAFPVRLVRLIATDSGAVCDSATTDDRGLFQLQGDGSGRYVLQFGPPGSRLESSSPVDSVAPDSTIARRYAVPVIALAGTEPFSERDVQRAARPTLVAPLAFPKELKAQNISGEVVVRYVVSASGRAVPASIVVARSTHPAFTRAVTRSLRAMMFEPARIGGLPVPQWVEQLFSFSLLPRKE